MNRSQRRSHHPTSRAHKHRHAARFATVLLTFGFAGCCTRDLGGTWVAQLSGASATLTMSLAPAGDATFTTTMTMRGTDTCSGALTYTGLRWASSCSTLQFTGTVACSGTIVCGSTRFDCASTGTSPIETNGEVDSYTESMDPSGATLTVQFVSGTVTFHEGP